MKKILSVGIAMLAISAAMAYPTLFNGTNGAVLQPTAAVADAGSLQVAIDSVPDAGVVGTAYPIRAVYGIAENIEVGAAFSTDLDGNNDWGIGGKWLTPLTLGGFAWAAGADYTDTAADVNDTILRAYFVGDRQFTDELSASVGLMGTRTERNAVDGGDLTLIRPYIAAEYAFENGFSVVADYLFASDNQGQADPSVAIRYALTESTTAQIGWIGGESFFIGLNLGVL